MSIAISALPAGSAVSTNDLLPKVDVGTDVTQKVTGTMLRTMVFSDVVTIVGNTQVANNPVLNLTQTWNNAAVAFSGLKLNVTNTASLVSAAGPNADSSMLLQLQRTGVDKFSVGIDGQVNVLRQDADTQGASIYFTKRGSNASATAAIASNQGLLQLRVFGWNGTTYSGCGRLQFNCLPGAAFSGTNSGSYLRIQVVPPSSLTETEVLRIQATVAGDAFIAWGGITNGFPALKRSAAELLVRLGDDTGYANLDAALLKVAGTQVVGARNTGWTTMIGTANKNGGALDTASVTTAQLAQMVKSILDALILHGLIGA